MSSSTDLEEFGMLSESISFDLRLKILETVWRISGDYYRRVNSGRLEAKADKIGRSYL